MTVSQCPCIFFQFKSVHGQVCVQPSTAAVNVTLLAFAAERRAATAPAAVDRYLLPAGRPAANPQHDADRQTDGRTPDRCIDPALLYYVSTACTVYVTET